MSNKKSIEDIELTEEELKETYIDYALGKMLTDTLKKGEIREIEFNKNNNEFVAEYLSLIEKERERWLKSVT